MATEVDDDLLSQLDAAALDASDDEVPEGVRSAEVHRLTLSRALAREARFVDLGAPSFGQVTRF
eukprot:1743660-Prymnesium_polylepis.2